MTVAALGLFALALSLGGCVLSPGTDMTTLFGVIRRQVLLNSQPTPQYADVRQSGHDGGDFLFMKPR